MCCNTFPPSCTISPFSLLPILFLPSLLSTPSLPLVFPPFPSLFLSLLLFPSFPCFSPPFSYPLSFFSRFLLPQNTESHPLCQKLTLNELMPIAWQRLTKYKLLIESILGSYKKHWDELDGEWEELNGTSGRTWMVLVGGAEW